MEMFEFWLNCFCEAFQQKVISSENYSLLYSLQAITMNLVANAYVSLGHIVLLWKQSWYKLQHMIVKDRYINS